MRRKKGTDSSAKKSYGAALPASPQKIKYDPDEADSSVLTAREKDVLYWVVRGKENADISGILRASPDTIRKHVENIRKKFSSESRLGVIASYWQREIDKRERQIADLERALRK
jgi:DNA-binding CsgD family transcriptional regulator